MKLPSIQQVAGDAVRTFRRFPFVLVDAVAGTVTALILVDYEQNPANNILYPILLTSILGFPLLLAASLIAERHGWRKSTAVVIQVVCVVVLGAYALSVPSNLPSAPDLHLERFFILGLTLCLLLATAPYAATRQVNGFWQYNKSLIQRIFVAGVFSLALYAGLSIALASIDQLFGVDIPGKRYGELGLFILGVFATWFFLADVPRDLPALENRMDYPKALRIFGQFILVPMLLVYFVILYAYVAKIAIEWSWPKGMVSMTIFGFAFIGITAYLLLYPLRDKPEHKWITVAVRWFWLAMIPMVVVLQLAIWRRISEYGITENRYLAFVLGGWLAAMAVYFLASKTKNIKVIPATLCVLGLLVSFGPWGAFGVSEQSQVNRLENLLTENGILTDGKVQKTKSRISADDAAQISSIIRYLYGTHGFDRIQPWFSESLTRDSVGVGSIRERPAFVVDLLGVDYARSPAFGPREFGHLRADPAKAINIEGYDHLLVARHLTAEKRVVDQPNEQGACIIDTNLDLLTVRMVESEQTTDSARISLRPFVDSLLAEHGGVADNPIPADRMSIETETDSIRLKVVFRKIDFRREETEYRPVAYDVVILYSRI